MCFPGVKKIQVMRLDAITKFEESLEYFERPIMESGRNRI
jgi:hypothetical protein